MGINIGALAACMAAQQTAIRTLRMNQESKEKRKKKEKKILTKTNK